MDKKPIIGLPADRHTMENHVYHIAGEKYLQAVVDGVGGIPIIIPALGKEHVAGLLPKLDGILLTGSRSNIEPHRYGSASISAQPEHDPQRDETNLSLIPQVLEQEIPLRLFLSRMF